MNKTDGAGGRGQSGRRAGARAGAQAGRSPWAGRRAGASRQAGSGGRYDASGRADRPAGGRTGASRQAERPEGGGWRSEAGGQADRSAKGSWRTESGGFGGQPGEAGGRRQAGARVYGPEKARGAGARTGARPGGHADRRESGSWRAEPGRRADRPAGGSWRSDVGGRADRPARGGWRSESGAANATATATAAPAGGGAPASAGGGFSPAGAGGFAKGAGRDGAFREDAYRSDMITGRNPVFEAIKAGRPINRIFVQRGEREGSIKAIEAMARGRGLVIQSVDKAKLDGMTGGASHQGVIALAAVKEYADPGDILAYAEEKDEPALLVVADGVEDPHNLGAIIRTAEAVGAHGLIIPKRRAVGLTPIVAKASSGAIEYMRIARVANIVSEIKALKRNGVWVVGADADSRTNYTDFDYTGGVAFVIGGEGAGLGRLAKECCDITVRLPMRGRISSLNASVAASVLLYEAIRQRGWASADAGEAAPEQAAQAGAGEAALSPAAGNVAAAAPGAAEAGMAEGETATATDATAAAADATAATKAEAATETEAAAGNSGADA